MPHVLVLIAPRHATTLTRADIDVVRDAVGGGIPTVLSDGEAVDIPTEAPPDMGRARAAIGKRPLDAIAHSRRGRRKGLLVADMDSTMVTGETLDELADFAGLKDRVAAITAAAMNGELNFADALRERVAMLRGLKLDALEKTWQRVRFTPGAHALVRTMAAHNATTALVSGGFTFFTERVVAALGFDHQLANVLLHEAGVLTGEVASPIVDRDSKVTTLRRLAEERRLRLAATLAVGDGANDLPMLLEAGLGIAFHAKPMVAARARARIDHADLRALLFAQGYRASDVVTG
jgi:phosphoserine phosphatase